MLRSAYARHLSVYNYVAGLYKSLDVKNRWCLPSYVNPVNLESSFETKNFQDCSNVFDYLRHCQPPNAIAPWFVPSIVGFSLNSILSKPDSSCFSKMHTRAQSSNHKDNTVDQKIKGFFINSLFVFG